MADGDIQFPDQHSSSVASLEPASSQPDDLNFPDKTPTLEKNFWDTYQADPDHSAKVLSLSQRFNEPELFINKNLDAATKAADAPSTSYWQDLEKNYPGTTQFLIDPKNMAVAKDDTANLAAHEGIVQKAESLWGNTAGSALEAGKLQEERDLLQAGTIFPDYPGIHGGSASFTGYLFNKLLGREKGTPADRIAGIDARLAQLEPNRPASSGISGAVAHGAYGAAEFVPWLAGGVERGAERGLIGAGVGALAGSETGPGAAITAAGGASVGFSVGEAEYNFLRMAGSAKSQFAQIRDANGNPLPEDTVNLAAAASGLATSGLGLIKVGAILKTIPGGESFLNRFEQSISHKVLAPATYKVALGNFAKKWATSTGEAAGAMAGITSINQVIGDTAEGKTYGPQDVTDLGKAALGSAGEAALTFGVMGLPGSAMGLAGDAAAVAKADQTKQVYLAMGATAEASKLRDRLPDAHRDFVDQVTKGSPIENIYTPAEQFEKYFQDQNIDPNQVAKELGVSESLEEARQTGGDVQIPMSAWANQIVGTKHYQGLADDIKFAPEDLTPRQVNDRKAIVMQLVQNEADTAVKENPSLRSGQDVVFNDIREQLVNAGRPDAEAKAAAQIWASRSVVEANRRGITPEAWYNGANLRVTDNPNVEPAVAAAAQTQGTLDPAEPNLLKQDALNPKDVLPVVSAESKTGEPHAVFQYNWQLAKNLPPIPYYRLYGDPELINQKTRMPGNEGGNTWRSDVSEETVKKAGIRVIGKAPKATEEPANTASGQATLFQSQKAPAPAFYSQLERTIEQKMGNKANPTEVAAMVAGTQGVKQEEIAWSGINEFLAEHKGPVEKKELLDFLHANQVQVEEVTKGGEAAAPQVRLRDANEALTRYLVDKKGFGHANADDYALTVVQNGLSESQKQFAAADPEQTALVKELKQAYDSREQRHFDAQTKFGAYTLPGGENYREMLFTLPRKGMSAESKAFQDYQAELRKKYGDDAVILRDASPDEMKKLDELGAPLRSEGGQGNFKSSHWDEPNVLAHVRMNDRTNSEGKKILHIEEVQSDWHQKGRDRGYQGTSRSEEAITKDLDSVEEEMKMRFPTLAKDSSEADDWQKAWDKTPELKDKYDRLILELTNRDKSVPDAPFKKSWHEFALKRMLRYAAENGYDKITWPTGEQQAERYDLANQVDHLNYQKNGDGTFKVSAQIGGRGQMLGEHLSQSELSDHVGKDVAQKMVDGHGTENNLAGNNEPSNIWKKLEGIDLKVGGEGMKGFYDKIIPEFANRYTKKWGGKVGATEFTTPVGETEPDIFGEPELVKQTGAEPVTVHSLEITPAMKESVLRHGQPLFQDITDPRGFIQFTPRETLVALVNADASTFMHESAHYWLKDLYDHVKSGQANEKTLADWKVLGDWMGIKEDQAELSRDQQEQFARGFESYLREGKSPSETLRKPFALFRRWLTRLYRDPVMLNVNVSNDVRGVMDRMLASEDEIAFAEKQAGIDAELTQGIEGIDPEVRSKIGDLAGAAHEQAVMALMKKQMKELTDEHQSMLAEEERKATKTATEAVNQLPEQQAIESIRRSTLKIKDGRKAASAFLDTENPMSSRDKQSMEILATQAGYLSADEMAKKILGSRPAAQEVASRVSEHMAQFADLRNTDKIKAEAMLALHNEKQSELMAYERQVFQDLVREAAGQVVDKRTRAAEAKVEAAAAKSKAKEIIAGKPVSEAGHFMPYFSAERNAAVNVAKALAGKDFEKAADYKRQQMLNHALVAEAYHARDSIDSAMKYFKRFATRGRDLKDMPYGFIRQIDQLLSNRGLADARAEDADNLLKVANDMAAQGNDPESIANATGWVRDDAGKWNQETLGQTAARISDNYYLLDVPESVLQGQPKPYSSMPLSDFQDLRVAVKSLNDIGRRFERFLSDKVKADVKTAAFDAANSIREKIGTPYLEQRTVGRKQSAFADRLARWTTQPGDRFMDLVNMSTLCRYLDGGKEDGPMQNFVYRMLSDGENRKLELTRDSVERVNKLFSDHFTPEEYKVLQDRKYFQFLSADKPYLTREEMVSMALNYGNEGNRQRLRDGYKLGDDQIMQVVNSLSKKEMDFVQATWDHLDSYWPKILALEMKATGAEPKKVENSEVHTVHGIYAGGYYPLAYDYEKSADAYQNADQKNALYKIASSVAAHTDRGHAKARVDYLGRPLRLSLGVFTSHVEDVVHDLAYRESVIDVNRFLRQKTLREAVQNAVGGNGLRALENQLKAVASNQGEPLDAWQKAVGKLRMGATISHMAYRLFNFPYYAAGNTVNGLWQLGVPRMVKAMTDFAMSPIETRDFVEKNSARMNSRASNIDRDIGDLARRWAGDNSVFHNTAFTIMKYADEVVTIPVWNEVYNHNLTEYGPDKSAHMADEAVTNIAGSGSILDRAAIQQGGEGKKIFTWMYSWLGMMFNHAWLDGKIAGLEYDKKNYAQAGMIMGKAAFYGWFLQGIVDNVAREFMRNSPTGVDDDKRKKRIAVRMVTQPAAWIPGVGIAASYLADKAAGLPGDTSLPFQGALQKVLDPFADLGARTISGKPLDQFPEHAASLTSMVTGYPQQFNTWTFNFLDYLNNKGELTWRDAMMRRTKN